LKAFLSGMARRLISTMGKLSSIALFEFSMVGVTHSPSFSPPWGEGWGRVRNESS
jgi:hypothetical protein